MNGRRETLVTVSFGPRFPAAVGPLFPPLPFRPRAPAARAAAEPNRHAFRRTRGRCSAGRQSPEDSVTLVIT